MKKFLTVAALGVALAVSGCGKSENAAGGPVKREAGNWKTDVKLVKFEVPGMPPEMKDGMAKMMLALDGAQRRQLLDDGGRIVGGHEHRE